MIVETEAYGFEYMHFGTRLGWAFSCSFKEKRILDGDGAVVFVVAPRRSLCITRAVATPECRSRAETRNETSTMTPVCVQPDPASV